MKIKLLTLGLMIALAGCATAKTWQATGGSRADGVVRLSYQYGLFEQPEVDEAAGQQIAVERCAVWGYTGAEAFGGVTEACNGYGSSGCTSWLVTKEYQCTGAGRPGMAEIRMTPAPVAGGV